MKEEHLNFKTIMQSIENDADIMMKEDENFVKENFTLDAQKKSKLMNNVWSFILNKLLGKLKIKITIYWDEKEIFNYVIPKN